MKCLACGRDKDLTVLETYPYLEDGIITNPVKPLFDLDCQPNSDSFNRGWKKVIVCHECFHQLDPDMWISEGMWKALNPVVPFEQLPDLPNNKI